MVDALRFADAAQRLAASLRARELSVPAFRSPPTRGDAVRTVRKYPGGWVVAVVLRDRPDDDVLRDMAQGALHANGRPIDDPLLTELLEAVTPAVS